MRSGKKHHSRRKSLITAFRKTFNMIDARRVSEYATILFNHDINALKLLSGHIDRWMTLQIERVDQIYKEREVYRNALCEIATLADNWKGNPMGVVANRALAEVGDVRDLDGKKIDRSF